MDGREEGRLESLVSWEKTPFGKEVSLLLRRLDVKGMKKDGDDNGMEREWR